MNSASVAFSWLTMFRYSQNSGTNDIVKELGIRGVRYGAPKHPGRRISMCRDTRGFGDKFLATPMHAWDTMIQGRDDLSWQHNRRRLKFGTA
ncbi:MAG TPA: hypothetical protein VLJ11_00365 [Bryobacteraceae bacterium]|nr:hypothetical protein [Bryobacteraceae bacterium]